MSDHDDTPAAGPPAAPEARKGWSEEDRRMLIITIAGGLAANLGTVILVGGAIALVHVGKASAGQPAGRGAGRSRGRGFRVRPGQRI